MHDEDAALNMGLVGRGARSRRVRDPERVRLGADGRVVQRPGDGPPPKTAEEIAKERRAEGDAITARVRAYEEGLRDIMNAICDALVHAHGVDPEVREHAANIWRGYVTHTGILTKDFGNPSTFTNPRRSFGKRTAGRGPTWINGASKKPTKKSDPRKRKRGSTKDHDGDASSDSDRPTSSSGDDDSSDDDPLPCASPSLLPATPDDDAGAPLPEGCATPPLLPAPLDFDDADAPLPEGCPSPLAPPLDPVADALLP